MNGIEVLEAQEALSESGRVDVEVVLGGTTFLTLPICLIRRVVPLDGRFEHVVLFCTSTPDHAIIWIDREVKRALDINNSCKQGCFKTHNTVNNCRI
ncbi:hypothetical protein HanRHA438_Chr09g0393901 [Helianthus annuus]|uniref:uncharacterized protein LOC110878078 isoform X2 n=1 Tax=Helianthus annuus TaxID=4232 RepID=UPI000B90867F|nr:uncharacterized protein LOC110878078 isoform X2 [Helianthus annuus]KAJ0887704.1 hypothetical protein HanRHA438_Chr09g0393901 [Helianthus annuus]